MKTIEFEGKVYELVPSTAEECCRPCALKGDDCEKQNDLAEQLGYGRCHSSVVGEFFVFREAHNTTTISSEEYDRLLEDSQWLSALQAAGVDNWEGFEEAMRILNEWNGEDNA